MVDQMVSKSFIQLPEDPLCPTDPSDSLSLEQIELLLQLQRDVLEDIVFSTDANGVVEKICYLAEELLPNSVASVMLLKDNKLDVYCAPSISKEGIERLNGLQPGPNAGSCGNVCFKKTPAFVSDTFTDDRWKDLMPIAEDFNLRACWSVPVRTEVDELVGTFALTSFETRAPSLFHRRLLDTCGFLIGIVLKREKLEKRLVDAAYYDSLTQLSNRKKLQLDLQGYIEEGREFVLAFIGLDRFKSVNDTYGHETGDYVLSQVAKRLSSGCGIALGVYRITGDEFAVVIESPQFTDAFIALAAQIETVLAPSFSFNDAEFFIRACVGFTYPLDELDSVAELMKRADTAMYAAKASNEQNFAVFSPAMADKVQEELQLERDLHHAINNQEFEVFYQPIMDADGKVVHSLEALIRWHHPEKGMISPLVFIPLAEEAGLIPKVSTFVVGQVISFLNELKVANIPLCRVSINLSGREFNPKHINELMSVIEEHDLMHCFEFELLESYLMENAEEVISLLNSIRKRGISIAIDDFGTGYSSLSYLKKFPVDKIKIDQSLIKDVVFDANDLAITKAVVAMARSLNLKVVAEGVETGSHSELLSELGVDYLQGFVFSKPVTSAEVTTYIEKSFS
ncbi:bifunctional diguanylate cyclase/phosphodiesterase [Hydrogenovibrio kuenenii]|uniref:bifunctional diguanylate cyclase/phosphodiesterase n=1 Tax=Hydrogenovibrio kuenenii TaxID=63658 RepID=UPI0004677C87|nr:EAL domain-containing protein [Hydrogenovibrio kuenenii]